MNFTWANRILLIFLPLLIPTVLQAEDLKTSAVESEPVYSFSAELMGGASYNLRDDVFKSQKFNISPSMRLLWKPDHRLNIGIEATYMTIRKIEIEKNKNKLQGKMEAIPLLLIFNMKAFYLDFTAGIGAGYVSSTTDVMKEVTVATNWHYCFLFGVGYSIMVSDYFGLGLEGRMFSFTKTNEFVSAAALKLIFDIPY
jgi:hypothetical protein